MDVLLPLKSINNTRAGTYVGSVLDREFNWIAGHERKRSRNVNYACVGGYSIDENYIQESDEEVILGGVFIKTFGYFFTECLSRLWYVIANETNLRIAVLQPPGHEKFFYDFIELLGTEENRILIVDKPTRFSKVIVPDQTVRLWSDFRREYISIYDNMKMWYRGRMKNCILQEALCLNKMESMSSFLRTSLLRGDLK